MSGLGEVSVSISGMKSPILESLPHVATRKSSELPGSAAARRFKSLRRDIGTQSLPKTALGSLPKRKSCKEEGSETGPSLDPSEKTPISHNWTWIKVNEYAKPAGCVLLALAAAYAAYHLFYSTPSLPQSEPGLIDLRLSISNRGFIRSSLEDLLCGSQSFLCMHPIEKAIQAAKESMKSLKPDDRRDALLLFGTLFDHNTGYDAAIQSLEENIFFGHHIEPKHQQDFVTLYKQLLQSDQGFDKAITAAPRMAKIWAEKGRGAWIFEQIIDKGKGLDTVGKIAQDLMINGDLSKGDSLMTYGHLPKGYLLFKRLIALNTGVQEAIETARALFGSEDEVIRQYAFDLIQELLARDVGIKEVIQIAQQNFFSDNSEVQSNACKLLYEFIQKNQGIQEAIGVAKVGFLHEKSEIKRSSLYLISGLIKTGNGYDVFSECAAANFGHKDKEVRFNARDIFQELFDQGTGFEAAAKAVKAHFGHQNEEIQRSAYFLALALVDKGQEIPGLIQVAKESIESKDKQIGALSLGLFKDLIDKKKGLTEISDFLQKNPNHPDRDIRDRFGQLRGYYYLHNS